MWKNEIHTFFDCVNFELISSLFLWEHDSLRFHPDSPKEAAGLRQFHRKDLSLSLFLLFYSILRQGLPTQLWHVQHGNQAGLELTEFHLSFILNAGIKGLCHHTWL